MNFDNLDKFDDIKQTADDYFMPTYARFNTAIVSGLGATLQDSKGKELIDFTAGIGVNALGYAHEGWVKAVSGQAGKLQHISNLYYNSVQTDLAAQLCEASGFDRVFFSNSGAEANECAIKLARKYSFDKYGEGRGTILSLVNSFHGRTMMTITATGQPDFHQYFHPFPGGFQYTPANDIKALDAALDSSVCALFIEIIQGEGGVLPLNADFVKAARTLCTERDILLVCDEVQTGIGRTGKLFAWEHFAYKPDMLTSAKGLGNGLPIGACLCNKALGNVLTPGTHGSTFGGNPIVCAGAMEVLRFIDDNKLYDIKAKGEYIKAKLEGFEEVDSVRGKGLMLGAKLKTKAAKDVKDVVAACIENGLLILTAKDCLRLLPPLVITYDEIDQGLAILERVLALKSDSEAVEKQ
ncbi:MAG TPA: aspartate aminotransferase family protein [Clostridia bacterium]|nr:aspartate aminotransferase family protein [Clostridia bacterium]